MSALAQLNMAVFAPIPSANDNTAIVVTPGFCSSRRAPYLMSLNKASMGSPRQGSGADAPVAAIRDAFS